VDVINAFAEIWSDALAYNAAAVTATLKGIVFVYAGRLNHV